MKKILSLTLVAIMLLSTLALTSCNEVFEKVGGFVGGVVDKIIPDKEPEYRTTITEFEWHQVAFIDNFTLEAKSDYQNITLVVDGDLLKADVEASEEAEIHMIVDMKNYCLITKTGAGWLAYKADVEMGMSVKPTLGEIGYLPEIEFSELEYSEEKGAYIYTDDMEVSEFYFRDGTLYEANIYDYTTEAEITARAQIKNVGSSVVEKVEYTVVNDGKVDPSKAPADVVTTVTDEQLAAHLDMRNFTLQGALMQYIIGADITVKVADTALELSVNTGIGEANMTQYLALIDGEFYSIEKYGDGHLATPVGGTMAELNEAIEMAREYMSTEYLIYNEEGRYYKLNVEGEELYLYFENGKLVKGVYMTDNMGMQDGDIVEIVFFVSNVGSTTVTLPEYIID